MNASPDQEIRNALESDTARPTLEPPSKLDGAVVKLEARCFVVLDHGT